HRGLRRDRALPGRVPARPLQRRTADPRPAGRLSGHLRDLRRVAELGYPARVESAGATVIDVEGLPAWGGLRPAAPAAARVGVAGIPYDGSAVYRRGAAEAPGVLRGLSAVM